jgi:hypothetical protein
MTMTEREMTPEEIVDEWFDAALFRDAAPHSYDRMVRDIAAAVEAERVCCERAANDGVFEALSDEVPDHFDEEGRRDGYTFAAMVRIATKVVLAIRARGE